MRTQNIILFALALAAGTAQAATLSYSCSYPRMPGDKPALVTINTASQKPKLIGTYIPADKSLPKIIFELGYNFHINNGFQLETAMYKPALLVSSGKATTAVYDDVGQTLAVAFNSGEILQDDEPSPGGNAMTNEFYIVCNPL